MNTITVAGRTIGGDAPCFIVAEAGVNHDGDPAKARELVDAAVLAQADAVKFQTFRTERLVAAHAPKADYQRRATGGGESQAAMLKKLELPFEAFRELAGYCREKGILFLSTPFDDDSVEFLFELGVPAFKLGSGELTNLPFLDRVARKGLPVIASTGMADLDEVEAAVGTLRATGNPHLALLHCVSAYPADPASVNLRAMGTLAKRFSLPVGFSDHTRGIEVAIGAAALGACIVEKHFTLDRRLPGPDHAASLEPRELAALVYAVRNVRSALGTGVKRPSDAEREVARVARRSLVAVRGIPAGTRLAPGDVTARRPGSGLPPARIGELLGRVARADIPAESLLTPEMFE